MRYQDQQFQHREQAILHSALALFRQHSWETVTIAEVAAAAGIGKGTVYKHFPSKEALFAELVLDFSQRCLEGYRQLPAGDKPDDRLRQSIRQGLADCRRDPLMAQLCMHCERPEFKERLSAEYRQRFAAMEAAFAEHFGALVSQALGNLALPASDCLLLLAAMDACFSGAMLRITSGRLGDWLGDIAMDAYLDQITDFIIAGLHGQAAHLLAQPRLQGN